MLELDEKYFTMIYERDITKIMFKNIFKISALD